MKMKKMVKWLGNHEFITAHLFLFIVATISVSLVYLINSRFFADFPFFGG